MNKKRERERERERASAAIKSVLAEYNTVEFSFQSRQVL